MFRVILIAIAASLLSSGVALGKSKAKKKNKSPKGSDAYTAIMSRNFDFDDTSINGEMRAPTGFFLQGRQNQSLSQMVRLRSSWKRQTRVSRSGVKAGVR